MLDPVLLAAGSLLLGSLLPFAWVPTSAALLASLLVLLPVCSRKRCLLALLLVVLGAWRASSTVRQYEKQRAAARDALAGPSVCSIQGVIVSSPIQYGQHLAVDLEVLRSQCEAGHRVFPKTKLRTYVPSRPLARGDVVQIEAKLGLIEIPRNFGADSSLAYRARSGTLLSGSARRFRLVRPGPWGWDRWIDLARWHARARIRATYAPDAVGMARALVLGENDLPTDDAEAFRVAGLTHLLAVSGSHIVIAVLGVVALIEKALRAIPWLSARFEVGRFAAAIGLPLTWLYEGFAGSGGSVRRAALMTSAALGARLLARQPHGVRAFALSMLMGALIDPLAASDVSFGLSAGATAGLMLLSRPLQRRLSFGPAVVRWMAAPVSATLSATLMCIPWLSWLSPNLSAAGVFANVVAVPIGESISLPACLSHQLLWWWPAAERGMALLGSGSLLAVREIARVAAAQDYLSFPFPRPTAWQLATSFVALVYLLVHRRSKGRTATILAVILVVLELLTRYQGHPTGKLQVSVLDVGQGDSILIDFPDGESMLVDGGGVVGSPMDPGKRIVLPILRAKRRDYIDVLVLSHPHPDHFLGLLSIVRQIRVGEFWDTGQGRRFGAGPAYAALISELKRQGVRILGPSDLCGSPRRFGAASVAVLAPCPDIDPSLDANDNSFVLKVKYGKHSALLTGDAEESEEHWLLRNAADRLKADFLKVGHHGSKTSSTHEFVTAVRPRFSAISCGVRNRFGHPANSTLLHLWKSGTHVFRTDRHGGVTWITDGTTERVVSVVANPL